MKKRQLLSFLFLMSLFIACEKDLTNKNEATPKTEAKVKVKAYNPYALANM